MVQPLAAIGRTPYVRLPGLATSRSISSRRAGTRFTFSTTILTTPECRGRFPEICADLTREPPLVWKAKYAFAEAKGIVRRLGTLVGADLPGWNKADCRVVNRRICRELFQLVSPCGYPDCLADIPANCEEYSR